MSKTPSILCTTHPKPQRLTKPARRANFSWLTHTLKRGQTRLKLHAPLREDRNCLPLSGAVLLLPPRCPSRRPTSAPARFFGRRPRSSPGCERTAGPEKHDRRGRVPPGRATKRRPGSAQTGNLAHQNGTQGYHLHDQRGDGSPLPPAGWGVRPTSASSTLATSFEAGCLEQAGRTYEEVVVCRGTQRTAKGSVARHQRGQPGRSSAADPEEQRQKDDGFGGRSGKGLGLLDGADEGQWACGGTIEAGGDSSVVDQKQLGLAINPSPWGAFVGGPPAERETELGGNRKRPSSAPRRPSTTTTIPAPGLEVGSGRRVQARPRSAHAASPSRNLASDVFVTAGYSSCDKEDGSGPKKVRVGAERATQNPARRRFRGGQPVSAVDRAELGEGTPGMDARRPSQADGARVSKSSYQQRAAAPGAGLVVIARQVKVRTIFSALEKGGRKDLWHKLFAAFGVV